MRNLSLYEQAGIVFPGAALLYCVLNLLPAIKVDLLSQGIGLGGLGMFLVLSYVLGHFVASVGNLWERLIWWRAGMPSLWLVAPDQKLLSSQQLAKVEQTFGTAFGYSISATNSDRQHWFHAFGQIYRYVLRHSAGDRILVLNGNYGLSRGLAAASILVFGIALAAQGDNVELWLIASLVFAVVFTMRMRRFGVYLAREVYLEFINPTEETTNAEG